MDALRILVRGIKKFIRDSRTNHKPLIPTLEFGKFLHHMIFQEKCFSCYILLTDPISLPDRLNFMRY